MDVVVSARKEDWSKEEVLEMQDELIAEFEKQDFQDRLHAALAAVGDDHARQNKVRQELTLPIQASVISKRGFPPTLKGVVESMAEMPVSLRGDPDIGARLVRTCQLVDRYAAPDEKWNSWPTSGEGLRPWWFAAPTSPVGSLQDSATAPVRIPVRMPTEQEREQAAAQEKIHQKVDFANHLAEAGMGIGMDSPYEKKVEKHTQDRWILTRQQLLDSQEKLIREYRKEEFQETLQAALDAAGDNSGAQIRARQDVTLPVQVLVNDEMKLNFEPTLKGVLESYHAFDPALYDDPEIAARLKLINVLVARRDPEYRPGVGGPLERDVDTQHDAFASKHPAVNVKPMEGRFWRVVGGHHATHHGLVVRKGPELSSPLLFQGKHEARLSTGAVAMEIELAADGQRLHYHKVAGSGPDFGWVSVNLHGAALLEPVATPVDLNIDQIRQPVNVKPMMSVKPTVPWD